MKIKYRLYSISNLSLVCYLLLILVACNSTSNKVEFKRATELYESRKDTLEKPYFHRRIVDSLLKDKTKKEMLLELVKRFKGADLDLIHEIDEGDSSNPSITIRIRKYFEDEAYYAIIYTNFQGNTDIDIYKLASQVIEHRVSARNYYFPTDTIFDVNGDGTKDFLVKSYPSSGCCRANIYNIFLSPAAKREVITSYIDLVNPTFYPQEKLIRGVEYDQPGYAGLYKYRWKGEYLDTLEYIYPDPTTKGRSFIKTHTSAYFFDKKKGTHISSLPEEYKTVEDLDWFFLYDEGTFHNDK